MGALTWLFRGVVWGADDAYTVAVDDIAEDEVLFTIPRSAVLSAENSDLKSKMISADSPNSKVQSVFESPWLVSNHVLLPPGAPTHDALGAHRCHDI